MGQRNGAGQSGHGRSNDPGLLVLTSLASGPKHGYALTQDIEAFGSVTLGPGTLDGVITRLEERGLIEPLGPDGRRRPYRVTASGREALTASIEQMRARQTRARPAWVWPRPLHRSWAGPERGMGTMSRSRSTRWIRWYPAAGGATARNWLALVEDGYGTDGPPLGIRLELRRSGVTQHLREAKLVDPVDRGDRVRSEEPCWCCRAWAVFMIVGAAFAKFSEQWDVPDRFRSPRPAHRGLRRRANGPDWREPCSSSSPRPIALPGVVRLVRAGRFGPVRAPMWRAVVVTAVVAATTLVVVRARIASTPTTATAAPGPTSRWARAGPC